MYNTNKYINIPFESHGRTFQGCDCYGLVRLFLNNELGKNLPDFEDYINPKDREQIQNLIIKNKPLISAKQIDTPEEGCIAVFNIRHHPTHLGVYIGNNYILHTMQGSNSLLEKIDSPRLRGRLEGFYEVR